jgi:sigma-B regulation protein RsbU (phosphoserine phosphatase)
LLHADRAGGDLIYVNAGTTHRIFIALPKATHAPGTHGHGAGIDDAARFQQQVVHLDPGDALILSTDGILDALNVRGEEFGDERLRRVCAQHHMESAAQIVAALSDKVLAFVGDQPLADDCTVVVVKRV